MNYVNTDDFKMFSNWLDNILEEKLPNEIVAFNFNLYECIDKYEIELIGSEEFDEEDEDWACEECFTTGDNNCYIERTDEIKKWEDGLEYITEIVKKYLNEAANAVVLKEVKAVGIGFVDGDIDIIYHK